MHFLVNIPEVTEMPKDCHHCPFQYMDLCGIERCKLSGEETRSTHNEKLNDCRITDTAKKIHVGGNYVTLYKDERMNELNYDDLDMWNGEGD